MQAYYHHCEEEIQARAHPWEYEVGNPSNRYYDFKAEPELIPRVLEDWLPWDRFGATKRFYRLLGWLNGPTSQFESNDCAFGGVRPNKSEQFQKPFECTGRLMILFRKLDLNFHRNQVERLNGAVTSGLQALDGDFRWGAVGTTIVPVYFVDRGEDGNQLMLSFWSWGESDSETMANLDRLIGNLWKGLVATSAGVGPRGLE